MTDADPAFEQARAAFHAGVRSLEAGRAAEAAAGFEAALALVPGRVSALVNLAAARLALGQPQAALDAAEEALAQEPDGADPLLHATTALEALGRLDEAAAHATRLAAAAPQSAAAWFRCAQVRERRGEARAALAAYERALALAPDHAASWSGYGSLLRQTGRRADAAAAYRQALAHGADPALHRWYLAAVAGEPAAEAAAAPRDYVRALFDGYAGDFDDHLVDGLGYQGHQVLCELLPAGTFARAVDLGCGTGLCGPLLRPRAGHLTGVDLSARMLERARRRGAYDALLEADIVDHLLAVSAPANLLLAADVLSYLGDLAPVFAAARRAAAPGAVFAFTCEHGAGGAGWALQPSLRYLHAEPYLRHMAGSHGFAVEQLVARPLRREQHDGIDGLYAVLRRAA